MSVDTGAYRAETAELLPFPLGHVSSVAVAVPGASPVPLTVVTGSLDVTFSEDWSPFAQVKLTTPLEDPALLDLLDPRLNVRVHIGAGYVHQDGTRDVHPLADVGLRERPVRRPHNTVSLDAASDEARTQDNRIMFMSPPMPTVGVNEAVRWLVGQALAPEKPQVVSDFADRGRLNGLADLEVELGADYWSLLNEVATRTDVRLWCDERRIWRLTLRPEKAKDPALFLTVGEAGTIITSESGLSREDWYNAALLVYRWRDPEGTDREIIGRARLWDGPYSVSAIGAKVYHESSTRRISQATADAAAASRLRNLMTRGRSLTLKAAAAYWLRPGHTVNVQLPTGAAENHLVRSVTFHPHTGDMDIVTRQPTESTIRTGE